MEYFGFEKQKKHYNYSKEESDKKKEYDAEIQNQVTRQVPQKARFHPIIASFPYQCLQADVLDMNYFEPQNHGRRYILTFIDVYSRYVWFYVMKKKSELMAGITTIWKQFEKPPVSITTDNEFVNNNDIKAFLKKHEVEHFVEDVEDHRRLGIINRFHRTIRSVIHRFMVKNDTKIWYKNIDELIDAYNNSYHRSIKNTPAEILAHPEKRKSNDELFKQPTFEIDIGAKVRVRRTFKIIDKRSSSDLWSRNVYTVVSKDKNAYILDNGKRKTAADLQVVTLPTKKDEPTKELESKAFVDKDQKEEDAKLERKRQNRLARLAKELAY